MVILSGLRVVVRVEMYAKAYRSDVSMNLFGEDGAELGELLGQDILEAGERIFSQAKCRGICVYCLRQGFFGCASFAGPQE